LSHLKTIEKMSEEHTWKARHQGTAENSHAGLCTRTAAGTNVKVQHVLSGQKHSVHPILEPQHSCAIMHPRNMICFKYVIVNNLFEGDK
jgi:hypothetical protein